MHIRRLSIKNIRAIREFEMRLDADECPGWHVILGDNGSGKSSVIRALAVVLMGAVSAHASRQDWASWLRAGEDAASIEILVGHHGGDAWTGQGNTSPHPITAHTDILCERDNGDRAGSATLRYGKGARAARTLWGAVTGGFLQPSGRIGDSLAGICR